MPHPLNLLILLGLLATGCPSTVLDDDDSALAPDDDDSVADDDDAAAGDTWATFGADFFVQYCNACHDGATTPQDFSNYVEVVAVQETIRCGTASATVPGCQGEPPARQFPIGSGARPSDAERDQLVAWIDAGLPE